VLLFALLGMLNGTCPVQLLESRPDLQFRLRQQQVLDAISEGAWDRALDLAMSELKPLALRSPELLVALEDTMILFAFPEPEEAPSSCFSPGARSASTAHTVAVIEAVNALSPVGSPTSQLALPPHEADAEGRPLDGLRAGEAGNELLSSDRRAGTASAANIAMLEYSGRPSSSRLAVMLASLRSAQERLRGELFLEFPAFTEASISRGGLREGSWKESERCSVAEVATAQLLSKFARGEMAEEEEARELG
jgi:hypothetical protein